MHKLFALDLLGSLSANHTPQSSTNFWIMNFVVTQTLHLLEDDTHSPSTLSFSYKLEFRFVCVQEQFSGTSISRLPG
jgi:hypothetical protein